MPEHPFGRAKGRIEYLQIESDALTNNVLGDPTSREVAVYLPPGAEEGGGPYPLMVDIVGFTGSGHTHVGWKAFSESVPQRVERLVAEGRMGEVIIALPDCFTSLGGNQYVNSSAMGNWADFLTLEMIPALESGYPVKPGREHRALFGKSSGGYGAIVHGMLHAEHWGAIACHSGDMDFDLCYRGDMAGTLMALAPYDGNIRAFIDKIKNDRKMSGSKLHTLMTLAMAATYDPNPDLPYGVQLPVDLHTCELIDSRWQQWLSWDPVHLIERADVQGNLRSLKGIYIDCGSSDQYKLVFGARRLVNQLTMLDIDHRYEEFADNHSSVDYRMDESLPFLFEAIN